MNYFNIFFQVSLLLEYCSKGDLKSFLVEHREEFQDALTEYHNTGFCNDNISKNSADPVLDVKILYQWGFQVRKCEYYYICQNSSV